MASTLNLGGGKAQRISRSDSTTGMKWKKEVASTRWIYGSTRARNFHRLRTYPEVMACFRFFFFPLFILVFFYSVLLFTTTATTGAVWYVDENSVTCRNPSENVKSYGYFYDLHGKSNNSQLTSQNEKVVFNFHQRPLCVELVHSFLFLFLFSFFF